MKLINANALDALKQLPSESVDCVITSPPYYGLRSYKGADTIWGGDPACQHEWISYTDYKDNLRFRDPNGVAVVGNNKNKEIYSNPNITNAICSKCGAWKGQLGLEPIYQLYTQHLMLITKELKRVLKPTGTLFWNMGDSYSGSHQGSGSKHKSPHGIQDVTQGYFASDTERETPLAKQDLPAKSLMMIPERFALAMIDDGWILRNKIIWRKLNGMPSSVKDRFANKWEYIFFFVKSKHYYFDLNAVRKPLADPDRMMRAVSGKRYASIDAKDAFMGNPHKGINKPRPNIKQKYEENSSYEGRHSGYFNEDGTLRINSLGSNPGDIVEAPAVRPKTWASNPGHDFTHKRQYDPNADGGDFLSIATIPHKEAHFAVYPETLVAPLIKAACPKGGIVLDPFAGSGTTGVVASVLGRDSILIEISEEYCNIIKKRFKPANLEKVVKLLQKNGHKDAQMPEQTKLGD